MSTVSKKIAVIGGGIFGVSCALELSSRFSVTLFEQLPDIMGMGTYGNQYRHHHGFHYPRSSETVVQCLGAQAAFESVWGAAIMRNFPAYYAIATDGSKTTPKQFLDFCEQHHLRYTTETPPPGLVNNEAVSLVIRTDEPIYRYGTLHELARTKLHAQGVNLRLQHEIVGAERMGSRGTQLTVKHGDLLGTETFDVVINATYANYNLLPSWLHLAVAPMEFRLKELMVVRIKSLAPTAMTIMDGPFVTLVPTGDPELFTFGDVVRSIIETKISTLGNPWPHPNAYPPPTRWEEVRACAPFYIPIMEQAEYVRSIFSVLPIPPTVTPTDARLTGITDHGGGCWSVFEGKIVTAVAAAQDLGVLINQYVTRS